MRYKVTIAYDGRNYAGFQSQINALAIQDVSEGVLQKIFSEKTGFVKGMWQFCRYLFWPQRRTKDYYNI